MTSGDAAKRVTLAQVARKAGVSVMTASYAYNQPGRVSAAARTKVLEAAAALGYGGPDPSAQSLRRGSTRTLGVVLGEHLSYAFDDPQAASFLAGIAEVCAEQGFGMTILPITGAADDAARVRTAAVDGFVVWTTSDDDPVLAAVRAVRRPAVVHGGPDVAGLSVVGIDNSAAARAIGTIAFTAARHPAVLSFPLSRDRVSTIERGIETAGVRFPVTRERLTGYRQAAEDLGIAWSDVVVAVCSHNDRAEAEQMTKALLLGPQPPDAIAAMGDEQAAGAVRAIRTAGLTIPRDVAVTGWDDAVVASELGVTTVGQSLREQGSVCARIALGQLRASPAAPWTVVRRTSTRPFAGG